MSYDQWIVNCAEACNCCPNCGSVPCGGCMAGGMCDNSPCRCDDEEWHDYCGDPDCDYCDDE